MLLQKAFGLRSIGLLLPVFIATGCSSVGNMVSTPSASTTGAAVIHGNIHGGQQPVAGATIQLYAAGAPTAGGAYGQGSTALITGTLPVSDANGNFSITGSYTLPTTASHLYIVATGGSPITGSAANSNIAMMAVLDGCTGVTSLSSLAFININEVTTMAAVMALQPFMAAPAAGNTLAPAIGAPSTATNDLFNAFATANNLASILSGASLTHSQSFATSDYNSQLVNTLGDILAYCINSATTGGQCANLFSAATPPGTVFTAHDTIQTAYYIAKNPTNNVSALYALQAPVPPFVGLSSAPADFTYTVATSASACQATVPLLSAANYAVLAASTVTNASTASDMTVITNGLVGVSPGTAETGFVNGTYVASFDNTNAGTAQGDLTAATVNAAGRLSPAVLPLDLSGITFTPGLYKTGSSVTLNSGSVYLDAQGDPNAVFIFQIGSTFTAAGGTQVILLNGASAKNVFWQVGSSATINTGAAWAGNILAYASISLNTDATLNGRALASNGAVTLLSNKITVP